MYLCQKKNVFSMKVATRFNTEFLTRQWLANLLKMQGVVLTVKGIIFVLFNRVTVKNCRDGFEFNFVSYSNSLLPLIPFSLTY